MILSGLIIQDPWISMILDGKKTWEIRGNATKKRGMIALIKSGTGKVIGVCEISDVIGPLTLETFLHNTDKHGDIGNNQELPYKSTYAWVLSNPTRIKPAIYKHPKGAITWVKVDVIYE